MVTGGRLKSPMAVSGSDWRSGLRLPLHHLHHRTEAFLEGDVKVKGEMIGVRALARFCVAENSRRRRAAALQGGLRPQPTKLLSVRQAVPLHPGGCSVRNMQGSHGFDLVHRPEPVERQWCP